MFIIKALMNGIVLCLSGLGFWVFQGHALALFGYEWPSWQRALVTFGAVVVIAVYLQFSSSKIIIREKK